MRRGSESFLSKEEGGNTEKSEIDHSLNHGQGEPVKDVNGENQTEAGMESNSEQERTASGEALQVAHGQDLSFLFCEKEKEQEILVYRQNHDNEQGDDDPSEGLGNVPRSSCISGAELVTNFGKNGKGGSWGNDSHFSGESELSISDFPVQRVGNEWIANDQFEGIGAVSVQQISTKFLRVLYRVHQQQRNKETNKTKESMW